MSIDVSKQLKPVFDNVLVKRLEAESKTSGGLIIPDTAKEKPIQGEVVAVGPGRVTDDGQLIKTFIKEGDKVLFTKYSGVEVRVDSEILLVLREKDIIALIED